MTSPISNQFKPNQLLNQGFDPNFELNLLQAGVGSDPNVATKKPLAKSLDLNTELAGIQALRAGTPSGGIGETVGGVLGTGAGTFFGGPAGGAAGSAIGKGVGAIVDFGLNKSATDKARKKELEAKRKLIARTKRLSNASKALQRKTEIQGIGMEREQIALSEEDSLRQQRESMLGNLMSDINQKDEFKQLLESRFLQSRRV